MATSLVTNLSIDLAKIWTGGHRLVYAPIETAFPGDLEDIINVSTWALETGWVDFGPTTDDGFEITREGDVNEGVAIDQRDYNLGAGNYANVSMGGSCTAMYTDSATLKLKWEFGTTTAIPIGTGVTITQSSTAMGSPATPTPRRLAVLQQNTNGLLRAFVFRRATVELGGSVALHKGDPEGTEVTFVFQPDPSITDGSDFGVLLEQTAA
jgi:hypothetical protein